MTLKNKTILITGADGFIGPHLTEALVKEGAKVKALSFYSSFNSWGWLADLTSFPFDSKRNSQGVNGFYYNNTCKPWYKGLIKYGMCPNTVHMKEITQLLTVFIMILLIKEAIPQWKMQ
jgi:hypothetical protein